MQQREKGMNTMDLNISTGDLDEIKAAIFKGNKIEAIKICRQVSGLGLAEAKTVVDTIEAELRKNNPGKFAAPAKGCLGVLVLFVAVSGAVLAPFIFG
jgi:ribosomal protein L7/L12